MKNTRKLSLRTISPTARGAYWIMAVLTKVEPDGQGLNTPGNCTPHAVTEINFGLHSAGRGRHVRHDRPGQGSTYLRAAINIEDQRIFRAVRRLGQDVTCRADNHCAAE